MPQIPFIPENAPFTGEQRQWLNGWLAGLLSDASANAIAAAPMQPAKPLVVLYGSQTGTAEGLAKKAGSEAKKRGFAPKIVCMEQYESLDFTKEENVLVITSTYGDGDPPDNAMAFWDYLKSDTAPPLRQLHFSVLALGDTNYAAFCEFGKKCDERFEQLGAKRVHPRIDCDVDYDNPAKAWTDGVFTALAGAAPKPGESVVPPAETGYSKRNPFPARLLANRLLNAPGSGKEVRHFEISLEGSGLAYEAGDALGVLPSNCPAHVSDLLSALACDGEEAVRTPEGAETSLRLALLQHYDIAKPSPDLLRAAAERGTGGDLKSLLDPARKDDLR